MRPLSTFHIFYGWWVLIVAVLAVFFTMGASSWSFSVLIEPMASEFGGSHSQLVGALTMAGVLGALVAPPFGRLVDKYGSRGFMSFGVFFFGIMIVLTSRAQTLWQFYVTFGIGTGLSRTAISQVGANPLAANWFIRRRGIAFAAIASGTSISGIFFPMMTQRIVDVWDWRTAWTVIGIGMIVIAAPLAWLVIRHTPEQVGLKPDGDDLRDYPETKERQWARHQLPDVNWTRREALATPTFWILNLCLTLTSFPVGTIFIIMHSYHTDLLISPTIAAQMVSFYAFSAMIAHPFWAALVQLFGIRRLQVPLAIFYGTAITLYLLSSQLGMVPLLFLAIFPLGISASGTVQTSTQIFADYYGRKEIASIIGVNSLLRIIPSAGGPLLAALLHDLFGTYVAAFVMFAFMCYLAGLGLVFARPPQKPTMP